MKNLFPLPFIALLLSLSSCQTDKFDPCDQNILKNSQTSNFNVSTKWKWDFDGEPATLIDVKIEFHKTACGFEEYKSGGDFTYTGKTDIKGLYNSGYVSYNIRNAKDRIVLVISRKSKENNDVWEQVQYEEFYYNEIHEGDNFLNYTFPL